MPLFGRKTVALSGLVGFLRLVVETDYSDEELYSVARETQRELRELIDQQVKDTLGQEFEVAHFEIIKGSLIVMIALGALGTVFMTFSRYESFVKSIALLISQMSGVLRVFFGNRLPGPENQVNVRGEWRAGPAVTTANDILNSSADKDTSHLLLLYLIVSHAALLAVLIWIVLRHLN